MPLFDVHHHDPAYTADEFMELEKWTSFFREWLLSSGLYCPLSVSRTLVVFNGKIHPQGFLTISHDKISFERANAMPEYKYVSFQWEDPRLMDKILHVVRSV